MTFRVLLVDDHTMFREALRSLLEKAPGIEVVGEASDGALVETAVARLAPDVVVMDVNMTHMGGIETTRKLLASHPEVPVIALSAYVYKRFVVQMLSAGAKGYIAKTSACDELVRAIDYVIQGKVYLCPESAAALAQDLRPTENGALQPPSDKALGRREREVLCLLAQGRSSTQIADALYIAPGTVDVHRRNIMRKLELHNVVELTKYAIREGLIPL